jgi:hypothetical protein
LGRIEEVLEKKTSLIECSRRALSFPIFPDAMGRSGERAQDYLAEGEDMRLMAALARFSEVLSLAPCSFR